MAGTNVQHVCGVHEQLVCMGREQAAYWKSLFASHLPLVLHVAERSVDADMSSPGRADIDQGV